MSSKYVPRPSYSNSPSSSSSSNNLTPGGEDAIVGKMDTGSWILPYRFLDHVRLGVNVSDTVKRKFKLGLKGAYIKGGKKNIFKQVFEIRDGEELLKASQCYLSTTAGRIPGLLFISNEKVAFCSERLITSNIANDHLSGTDEKMEIPLRNIRRTILNEQQQKCIKIIREDNTELLFVGFVRYEKARQNLKLAISRAESSRSSLF